MIRWIVERYAPRMGYRKVPPRDVWAMAYIEGCNPSHLTEYGHRRRSQALMARRLAVQANDALDQYEAHSDEMRATQ